MGREEVSCGSRSKGGREVWVVKMLRDRGGSVAEVRGDDG